MIFFFFLRLRKAGDRLEAEAYQEQKSLRAMGASQLTVDLGGQSSLERKSNGMNLKGRKMGERMDSPFKRARWSKTIQVLAHVNSWYC